MFGSCSFFFLLLSNNFNMVSVFHSFTLDLFIVQYYFQTLYRSMRPENEEEKKEEKELEDEEKIINRLQSDHTQFIIYLFFFFLSNYLNHMNCHKREYFTCDTQTKKKNECSGCYFLFCYLCYYYYYYPNLIQPKFTHRLLTH